MIEIETFDCRLDFYMIEIEPSIFDSNLFEIDSKIGSKSNRKSNRKLKIDSSDRKQKQHTCKNFRGGNQGNWPKLPISNKE